MISGLHKILKDPQCAGNIKSAMWAAVVVCLYFSFMVYGFFLLDYTTMKQNNIYIERTYTGCVFYKFNGSKGVYKVCTNSPAQ